MFKPRAQLTTPLISIAWLLLGLPTISTAELLQRPSGLVAGQKYRLIFVTDGTRDATSVDIDDYNAFINQEANKPGSLLRNLREDFSAVATTPTVSAIDNVSVGLSGNALPIYLADGRLFATNTADLFDGSFGRVRLVDQYGKAPRTYVYFNGSSNDGTAFPSGFELGSPVYTSLGAGIHLHTLLEPVVNENRFVGISRVLVVVPEPATVMHLGLASVFCALKFVGPRRL